MDDAGAAAVAREPHDVTGGEARSAGEAFAGALEVAVEDDVMAQPSGLADEVIRDDGAPEEGADERYLGLTLLVLELRDAHVFTPRGGDIDASMAHGVRRPALGSSREVEVVSAEDADRLAGRPERVSIGGRVRRTIGPARDVVIRLEPATRFERWVGPGERLVPLRALIAVELNAEIRQREADGALGDSSRTAERWLIQRDGPIGPRRSRRGRGDDRRGACLRPVEAAEGAEHSDGGGGSDKRMHRHRLEFTATLWIVVACERNAPLVAPVFVQDQKAIEKKLNELFDAERATRKLHDELSALPEGKLLDALTASLAAALKEQDEAEASLRLVRLASLLGELQGPRVVDALIDVLTAEHPEARQAAGEEIEQLAFERFKEVALGVERALKRLPLGSPALPELPYLLAEVPEPGVTKLLGMFLKHQDPDAVAAAIESLVEIGDPAAGKLLEPLLKDERTVELADDGGDTTSEVTLGELASEALDLLMADEEGGDDTSPAPAS